MLLERRCKSFDSSDGTGVGGCGSQSGSNSAVSGWSDEREVPFKTCFSVFLVYALN